MDIGELYRTCTAQDVVLRDTHTPMGREAQDSLAARGSPWAQDSLCGLCVLDGLSLLGDPPDRRRPEDLSRHALRGGPVRHLVLGVHPGRLFRLVRLVRPGRAGRCAQADQLDPLAPLDHSDHSHHSGRSGHCCPGDPGARHSLALRDLPFLLEFQALPDVLSVLSVQAAPQVLEVLEVQDVPEVLGPPGAQADHAWAQFSFV